MPKKHVAERLRELAFQIGLVCNVGPLEDAPRVSEELLGHRIARRHGRRNTNRRLPNRAASSISSRTERTSRSDEPDDHFRSLDGGQIDFRGWSGDAGVCSHIHAW